VGRLLPAGAIALAVFAVGCRREAGTFRGSPVILICVDTLRADRLPAYGYRQVQTPNLDALRRDAVLFENAYAHVPMTLPSHVSLFTGLLPPQTGVRDNLGYRLGEGPETLAGFLARNGYRTGAAVSSIVLSRATGIHRGFESYSDDVEPTTVNQSLGRVQRDGEETARRLEEWIAALPENAKFFAFLHLFEPHSPYTPPEPYRSRYPRAYDGEVARADEIVGSFVAFLKKKGLYEDSVILFLSDHGEGLNDHGEEEHGVLLYREAIRVPLMLKLPRSRRGGATVAAPAGLIDVFPTVAGLLNLKPPAALPGVSWAGRLSGSAPPPRRIYSETLYPRLHLGWSDLASLVDERWHYIEAPRAELYDVASDPAEKKDLSPRLPPAFRSMRAELARMERPVQPPGTSDPEQARKLAALGYISAASPDAGEKNLPDPKDRVAAVEKLKGGFGALQAGRFEEAVANFRALLAENPRMTDVWQMLAQAYLDLGRDREAHAALQEAIRLAPANPQVLLALSEYYLKTGDFARAREHAELARDGGAPNSALGLARIALAQGDMAAAEAAAAAALRETPRGRIPHLILARVRRERGDLPGALEELETARRLSRESRLPPLSNVEFLRGDVLARLGREREAEEAFQEEIRSFPTSPSPRTGLAILYASQGREPEALRALADLIALKSPEALSAAIRTFEVLGDPDTAASLRARRRRLFPEAGERRAADAG
jgi:choline-sulfatase